MMPRPTDGPFYKSGTTPDNIKVYWYNKIEEVPRNFSVVIAHEFFDALPVHKFQVRKSFVVSLINFLGFNNFFYNFFRE